MRSTGRGRGNHPAAVAILLGAFAFAAPAVAGQEHRAVALFVPANVYVIRENAQPTVWATSLKIDGITAMSLGQRTYTALHVAPGTHEFRLAWPFLSGQRDDHFNVDVAEGQTYYFVITGQSRVTGFGYNSIIYRLGSSMVRIAAEDGRQLVSACCQLRPSSEPRFAASAEENR